MRVASAILRHLNIVFIMSFAIGSYCSILKASGGGLSATTTLRQRTWASANGDWLSEVGTHPGVTLGLFYSFLFYSSSGLLFTFVLYTSFLLSFWQSTIHPANVRFLGKKSDFWMAFSFLKKSLCGGILKTESLCGDRLIFILFFQWSFDSEGNLWCACIW